jgi:membrane associated rhomboid family serine protease/Tfp pilus assembly protein PilF
VTAPPGVVVLHRPRATWTLLVAIAVVYVMSVMAGGADDFRVLLNFGANLGPLVWNGDLWRLAASLFLHASLLHLVLNGMVLWVIGRNVEAFYGPWGLIFLFTASGVAGSIASAIVASGLSVGASGAIFGLVGASIVFAFRHRGLLPRRVTRVMGLWLLPLLGFIVVGGFLDSRIDSAAHLGGLVTGALLALLIRPAALEEARGRSRGGPRLLASFAISFLLLSLGAAASNLFRLKGPAGPMLDPRAIPAMGLIDPEAAIALATEELARSPEDPSIWTARAGQLAQSGRWLEAVRDYQRALELAPGHAAALNDFAWLLLEQAPEGLRNSSEAGRLARRALEAAPTDPYVLGTYGTWLLRSGRPEAAVEYLARALDTVRPVVADATDRYLLAIALAGAGRADEARSAFEAAVELDPGNDYRSEAEAACAGVIHRDPAL